MTPAQMERGIDRLLADLRESAPEVEVEIECQHEGRYEIATVPGAFTDDHTTTLVMCRNCECNEFLSVVTFANGAETLTPLSGALRLQVQREWLAQLRGEVM